jgi:hypothetical protein
MPSSVTRECSLSTERLLTARSAASVNAFSDTSWCVVQFGVCGAGSMGRLRHGDTLTAIPKLSVALVGSAVV